MLVLKIISMCVVHGRTGEVFLDIIETWCEENNIPQLFRSLLVCYQLCPLCVCVCTHVCVSKHACILVLYMPTAGYI